MEQGGGSWIYLYLVILGLYLGRIGLCYLIGTCNTDQNQRICCKKKFRKHFQTIPDCTVQTCWVWISFCQITVQQYLEIDLDLFGRTQKTYYVLFCFRNGNIRKKNCGAKYVNMGIYKSGNVWTLFQLLLERNLAPRDKYIKDVYK